MKDVLWAVPVPVCFIYFNFRFSVIFPLYVPFYSTIPRVALTKIMGVPVTGKTLNYILGLQIASSDMENILVVGCAVVSQYPFFFKSFISVFNSTVTHYATSVRLKQPKSMRGKYCM